MMPRRVIPILLYCTFAVLAAGCASSPPVHFFTLSATPRLATSASTLSIAVGPVSLPAIVDRPQIVVSNGPNTVRLDEFNRWASPLQDNLPRVVAENLAALLGTPRVSLSSQASSSDADYRLTIDVQTFASMPGQAATLDASWTVRRMRDGQARSGRSQYSENVPDRSYAVLAAAHSRALGRLSDDLGSALRALEQAPSSGQR